MDCGSTENLTAHHKHSFVAFPQHRYKLENILTLCLRCHDEREGYAPKEKSDVGEIDEMSAELAIQNHMALTLSETMTLGKVLAQSGYFRDANDAAKCVVKVMAGAEVGIPPIASMKGIHIIEGKPSFAAATMGALVKKSGKYNYKILKREDTICTIEFFERAFSPNPGWESIGVSTFTWKDAERANLTTKAIWKSYPANMLLARAMSTGVNAYCPDVFMGPVYTPEELGASVNQEGVPLVSESETIIDTTYTTEAPAQATETAQDPTDWKALLDEMAQGYGIAKVTVGLIGKLIGRKVPAEVSDWGALYEEAYKSPDDKWQAVLSAAKPKTAEAPTAPQLTPEQDKAFSEWMGEDGIGPDRQKFSEVVGRDLPCNEIGFGTLAEEELAKVNAFLETRVMPREGLEVVAGGAK